MLWLAIVLIVLVAGYWVLTLLVKLPLWIAVVVTAVALLVFVGVVVFLRVRAARRAAALERELLRQAAHQADQAQPKRRADILALQQQMKEAIDSLKRSKLGAKSGKAALYALPWYVIVGPPAAGKTTAIERSGLSFAGGARGGAKVRGTAGTRNCDWWFSRDAILLDTAGRFSTEDEDREQWLAFLDTVRRFRPERPIDGLVVAVSLDQLASLQDPQVEELSHKLRERVDEVLSRLEMVLPVYVLYTKADLVAGFVEFFGDYAKPQRAQAWGATFALDDERLEDPARAFEAEFDELVRVLHSRMLERLARENLPEVRAKVLQFPLEFQSLRAPLARFMEELCRHDPYTDAPIVRGFYFCSGTQTGRPLERVLHNMAHGFDLRLAASPQQPVAEPHSYFVTQLFEKIIFPDRELAVRSGTRMRRQARRQAIVAGAAVFGMLVLLVPAMISYAKSRKLINETVNDVAEARRLEKADDPNAGLKAIDVLQGRVKLLEEASSSTRIPGWWGERTAPELLTPSRALYMERLRRAIQKPAEEQLTGEVRAIEVVEANDVAKFRGAYDQLKLYLMLGNPQERLDPPWAVPKLSSIWSRTVRGEVNQEKLDSHLRYYLEELKKRPQWAWQLDASAITRAQGRLNELPLADLVYGWLAQEAQGIPPIRAESIFYGPSAEYFSMSENAEVPGLYTKRGWAKVLSALDSPDASLAIEPWVLGRQTTDSEADGSAVRGVKDLYFKRYVRAWSQFLNALQVSEPKDRATAVRQLRILAESDGPYVRLFTTLRDNVALQMPDKSLKEKLVAKGKELLSDAGPPPREVSPVEEHFKPMVRFAFGEGGGQGEGPPPKLTQYLTQLTLLEAALNQGSDKGFAEEVKRAGTAVQALFGGLSATSRTIIEGLLMPPIRGTQTSETAASVGSQNTQWKQVWDYWNTTLAPRFPFKAGPVDASVAEFAEFFRPQTGLLWAFFEQNLKTQLVLTGRGFAPRSADSALPFLPDFLRCLADAQEITKAVFGSGPEPIVPFGVNILPAGNKISEISLVIDGKAIVYRNEPERWQPAQWPGKGASPGGTLKVRGAGFTDQLPRDGEFGFFRLLAEGAVKPVGPTKPGVLVGSWKLAGRGDASVTIELKPTRSIHPFAADFFSRLKCPAAMLGE